MNSYVTGWEEIENPIAKRMAKKLMQLYIACHAGTPGSAVWSDNRDLATYRDWLKHRLEESAFLARLDQGLDSLPNIEDSIPVWMRPIQLALKPRNIEGLIFHIARNLEWYLDPTTRPKTPGLLLYQASMLYLLVGIGLNAQLHVDPVGAWGFWLGLGGMLFSIGASKLGLALTCGEAPNSAKFGANCQELYRCLVDLHTSKAESVSTSPQQKFD